MSARAQVKDLRDGDVVELSIPSAKLVGTLRRYGPGSGLAIAPNMPVRESDGGRAGQWVGWALTIVSRAPRLYVNHDRTEPVVGDVVRVDTGDRELECWYVDVYLPRSDDDRTPWVSLMPDDPGARYRQGEAIPQARANGRAVLLVDGETGRCVP